MKIHHHATPTPAEVLAATTTTTTTMNTTSPSTTLDGGRGGSDSESYSVLRAREINTAKALLSISGPCRAIGQIYLTCVAMSGELGRCHPWKSAFEKCARTERTSDDSYSNQILLSLGTSEMCNHIVETKKRRGTSGAGATGAGGSQGINGVNDTNNNNINNYNDKTENLLCAAGIVNQQLLQKYQTT